MHRAILVALGVAAATPVFARTKQQPPCPEMPTTNDVERSREGGLSLQLGGFGVSGNRSKSMSRKDVMMREGGFPDWSAAAVLSHACHVYRDLYRGDLARQRDAFAAERERLLGRPAPQPSPRPMSVDWSRYPPVQPQRQTHEQPAQYVPGGNAYWKPLSTSGFMPQRAIQFGIRSGSAVVDCSLSRTNGLSDCQLVSEIPTGYGLGAGVLRYARALRLTDAAKAANWQARRVRWTLQLRAK